MARLPLLSVVPAGAGQVFERFHREGRRPIDLYRALANNPSILRAFSDFGQVLRYENTTPRELRELAIMRTAWLTGSRYEWAHHLALATEAGVDPSKLVKVVAWQEHCLFSEAERAVLQCVDEMHELRLSDACFERLRRQFTDAEVVEVVMVIAFYQAVARVLQAIDVEVEPEYREYLSGDAVSQRGIPAWPARDRHLRLTSSDSNREKGM